MTLPCSVKRYSAPAFQLIRLPDLAVSTVVTGLPVDCPGGQAIAPRPLPPQAVALSYWYGNCRDAARR